MVVYTSYTDIYQENPPSKIFKQSQYVVYAGLQETENLEILGLKTMKS